jgi:hypothetical protein
MHKKKTILEFQKKNAWPTCFPRNFSFSLLAVGLSHVHDVWVPIDIAILFPSKFHRFPFSMSRRTAACNACSPPAPLASRYGSVRSQFPHATAVSLMLSSIAFNTVLQSAFNHGHESLPSPHSREQPPQALHLLAQHYGQLAPPSPSTQTPDFPRLGL